MRPRFLLAGTIAGGITLFIWGAISNMVIPWPGTPLHEFTDAGAVLEAVRANAPVDGVYFAPPNVFAAVRTAGVPADGTVAMGSLLLVQFATDLVAALLIALLLLWLAPGGTRSRSVVLGLAALAAAASYIVPQWNWWGFSVAWTFAATVDLAVRFLVAGLVIGALQDRLKPARWGTAAAGTPASPGGAA